MSVVTGPTEEGSVGAIRTEKNALESHGQRCDRDCGCATGTGAGRYGDGENRGRVTSQTRLPLSVYQSLLESRYIHLKRWFASHWS